MLIGLGKPFPYRNPLKSSPVLFFATKTTIDTPDSGFACAYALLSLIFVAKKLPKMAVNKTGLQIPNMT